MCNALHPTIVGIYLMKTVNSVILAVGTVVTVNFTEAKFNVTLLCYIEEAGIFFTLGFSY